MNNTKGIEAKWLVTKGKLKEKFAKLTDNDLLFLDGKQDEMMGRLQLRLGKTREEILQIISDI